MTAAMLPEKKFSTNLGVGLGVLLQVVGCAVGDVGVLLILASIPPFIWGCMNYAEGKGHSKWVGVVGLAGCIGLLVLILLPDEHEEGQTTGTIRLRNEEEGRALLLTALRLETSGHLHGALAIYRRIEEQLPGTEVARDATVSARQIKSSL